MYTVSVTFDLMVSIRRRKTDRYWNSACILGTLKDLLKQNWKVNILVGLWCLVIVKHLIQCDEAYPKNNLISHNG